MRPGHFTKEGRFESLAVASRPLQPDRPRFLPAVRRSLEEALGTSAGTGSLIP